MSPVTAPAPSGPRAEAEAALRAGDPGTALTHLSKAVRAAPNEVALRIFLAQLMCVLGQWERAQTQLNVIVGLDASASQMRETVAYAMRSELVRAKVFAGEMTPMVIGEPEAWMALLLESLQQERQGKAAAAAELAARALEAAPTAAGQIDGTPFEWIADADSRLGPVLEACVNGQYYWIPFSHLAGIEFEAPEDLRDVVWLPAELTFRHGGKTVALVPSRYPDSAGSDDPLVVLARKSTWRDTGGERWLGSGQRVFATDAGDYPLLTVRRIAFDPAPPSTPSG